MKALFHLVLACVAGLPGLAQTPSPTQKAPDAANCSSNTAGAPKPANGQPCGNAQPAPKNAAEKFPYPGEAAQPAPEKQSTSPAPLPGDKDAAKQFPYPGESSSSSSSSSSSNNADRSSSSSNPGDPDMPPSDDPRPQPTARRKLPKVERILSNEDRESEDLTVASFYLKSGNPQASYLRAKDAIKMEPDDPEAHFALAEAAHRLAKKDEAVAEYTAYLKLDPGGDRVKSAQKALASLK